MVRAPHQGYDKQGEEIFLEQVLGQETHDFAQVDYLVHIKHKKLDANYKC